MHRSLFQSIGRKNGVHYENPQALVKTGKKTYCGIHLPHITQDISQTIPSSKRKWGTETWAFYALDISMADLPAPTCRQLSGNWELHPLKPPAGVGEEKAQSGEEEEVEGAEEGIENPLADF